MNFPRIFAKLKTTRPPPPPPGVSAIDVDYINRDGTQTHASTHVLPIDKHNNIEDHPMMMDRNKKALKDLKDTPEYIKCRASLKCLKSLLTSRTLMLEYGLLKSMVPKVSIRLRHSYYSRSIEQLYRVARKIFPLRDALISNDFGRLLDHFNKASARLEQYRGTMEQLATLLTKMAISAKRLFRLAKMWLDLGHLVTHFLLVSCLASRIFIYSKALLIYLYDVYRFLLLAHGTCHPQKCKDALRAHLTSLNIPLEEVKSKVTKAAKEAPTPSNVSTKQHQQPTKSSTMSQDIGVPLQRKEEKKGGKVRNDKKSKKRRKQQQKNQTNKRLCK